MTARNYFKCLGIDGSAILPERTKTERFICHAFQLHEKVSDTNYTPEKAYDSEIQFMNTSVWL